MFAATPPLMYDSSAALRRELAKLLTMPLPGEGWNSEADDAEAAAAGAGDAAIAADIVAAACCEAVRKLQLQCACVVCWLAMRDKCGRAAQQQQQPDEAKQPSSSPAQPSRCFPLAATITTTHNAQKS